MKITATLKGLDVVMKNIKGMERQIPFATARALTQIANLIRQAVIDELARVLDRPTSYTMRQSMQVIPAKKTKLEAVVGLGIKVGAPGKGTPYVKALGHLFTGGTREWKRMEAAFMKAGILPGGHMMVPASNSWAMKLDQYGNAPRGLVVTLLSYFSAFGEQGYKANATDRSKARRAKLGKTQSGYKVINGVVYFASYGKSRGSHLSAGIWAKRGTHGSDVAPVFLFVKRGSWRQQIDLHRTARSVFERNWNAILKKSLSDAMGSAR